jgi:Cu/Ag efflux protein CusF
MAMKRIFFLVAIVGISAFAGCQRAQPTKSNEYPIEGKVVAVNKDKPAVKLDHKDIPGLMQGMQMEFRVSDAKLLDGLKEGDYVRGKLKDEGGTYVIIQLEKSDSQSRAEPDITTNLAKLSSGDRQLAATQKYCAVQGKKSRLGSMGTPVKIMIRSQPVFLCCESCIRTAEASPDQTLARLKELRKANR